MQRDTDLPSPTGLRPVRGLRLWRWVAAIVLVAAVGAASFLVPLPFFYAYLPGPVRDVQDLVTVEGTETFSSEGKLYLTTVSVDLDVTFADAIAALLDKNSRIVGRDDVTGGQSFEDLESQQRQAMDTSKQHAIEVALAQLGRAMPSGDGARVVELAPDTPAEGVLQEGDVIVGIDGDSVSTTCEVGRAIDRHAPGEQVDLTVKRNGRQQELTVDTIGNPQDPDTPIIGILMNDVNYEFDPGIDVEFETGRIAGPSAGLMFTLALYDRLTPDDLTGGRAIAGTGEISCDGGVIPIGGIEQKVAGAEDEGAEIFLSPAANFEAAQAAAGTIEVVSISNFSQAVEYLEGLEPGSG
jgi:PDZ domain-containing protein